MKVAIIGIQGVPAKYGGFETLVENLLRYRSSDEIEYTVFCSTKDQRQSLTEYLSAKLRYLGLSSHGAEATLYDIKSMWQSRKGYDVVVVLGVTGCLFLPIFRLFCKSHLIVNIDGLEHRRGKWSKWAKIFLRTSEAMAVRCGDVIISDNKGIQDYVRETYKKDSVMIAYGGDHVLKEMTAEKQQEFLDKYNEKPGDYAMTVCRIEPENNCHVILEAFEGTGQKILMIGNWDKSEYGKQLKAKYEGSDTIMCCAPEYDLDTLYALRNNAKWYIHGHSAGGTNPSLVEAMFFGRPIIADDCVYNRATTGERARFFKDVESLRAMLKEEPYDGAYIREFAEENYTWKHIASQYESLYK